jgi:hypothetical protein
MSTAHGPSSSPEASSSKLDLRGRTSGSNGKAKEEWPAALSLPTGGGGGDVGSFTTAADGTAAAAAAAAAAAKKPLTKKNKHPKGTGPGKGWRAGRGGGTAGKRTRKKVGDPTRVGLAR